MNTLDKHLFILGPTGVGKTELSLQLAEKTGVEVCSFDAFQVYQDMNIGTAKATLEEQKRVKHHLIDLIPSTSNFSVADFIQYASKVDLSKPKIWVGGTGLFYRSLHSGLCEAPASDPIMLMEMEKEPFEDLQKEIQKKDPVWCLTADLQNPRRVFRALSVVRQTGIPLSTWQQETQDPLIQNAVTVCLTRDKNDLHHRIQTRTREMLRTGWIEETESLLKNLSLID